MSKQNVVRLLQEAADRIRGPLLGHEEVLICRGVRECPLNADGEIQWPVISHMLLRHRCALDWHCGDVLQLTLHVVSKELL